MPKYHKSQLGPDQASSDQDREVARLVQIRQDQGDIPQYEYEESLERLGRTATEGRIGYLRTLVNKHAPRPPAALLGFEPDEDCYIALARATTLGAFHETYIAKLFPGSNYSAFYRWFQEAFEPGLRALIQPGKKGIETFRRAILSCLWHCDRFGQAWQTDVVTLPFKAVPPGRGYTNPVRVKLIAIIDDATRLIVAWKLVYCVKGRDVRATDVADVLIGAMHRWGVPEQIVMDNGNEFDNDLIAKLLVRTGTAARLTPRYRGESKGKIERFNRSVNGWFAREFATWTTGPASAARYPILGNSGKDAPSHTTVINRLSALIDWYNTEKVHSGHGLTPLQAREADPTELPPLILHHVLHLGSVHNQDRKDQWVSPQTYGINYDNRHWTCLDPDTPGQGKFNGVQSLARAIHGRHGVRVRPVNGDDTIVGIYDVDDRFICIATRMDQIPTDIKLANRSSNDEMLHHAERILAEAHRQIAEETGADQPEEDNAARRAATTISTQVAELLAVSHDTITMRWDKVTTADGDTTDCRILSLATETNPLDADTAIRVLMAWIDNETQEIYRLETPTTVLSYDTTSAAARVIDRATGDIDHYIAIAFPNAA